MTGKRKKMKITLLMLAVLICCWTWSCKMGSTDTETDPGESFSKIYEKTDKSTYTAVDIKQTPDSGYIILGMRDSHPYLLRVDSRGNFLWDRFFRASQENEKYFNPIPGILVFNEDYYFFCNIKVDKHKYIAFLKLSESDRTPQEVIPDFTPFLNQRSTWNFTPFDATQFSMDNGDLGILLLALCESTDQLILVKFDGEGKFGKYEVNKVNSYVCIYSTPFTDRRFHFNTVTKYMDKNYYNFQSYSGRNDLLGRDIPCFSITRGMKRTEEPDKEEKGVFYISDIPFIALEWHGAEGERIEDNEIKLGSITLSAARIENHIISFFVNSKLIVIEEKYLIFDTGTKQYNHEELIETTPVYIRTMTINNQGIVFFAGSSKNNRIVLYAYDQVSGEFLDKKYFGHTHIFQAAGLIETTDGGLGILGSTYVAGRLGRLCLFKLSKGEVENIVNSF